MPEFVGFGKYMAWLAVLLYISPPARGRTSQLALHHRVLVVFL
jgi:hypothetical protein